jgi:hypothetical protein
MDRPTDPFDPASLDAYIAPILDRAATDVFYLNDIAGRAEVLLELFVQHGLLDLEVTGNGRFAYCISNKWKRELSTQGYDLSNITPSHLYY